MKIRCSGGRGERIKAEDAIGGQTPLSNGEGGGDR